MLYLFGFLHIFFPCDPVNVFSYDFVITESANQHYGQDGGLVLHWVDFHQPGAVAQDLPAPLHSGLIRLEHIVGVGVYTACTQQCVTVLLCYWVTVLPISSVYVLKGRWRLEGQGSAQAMERRQERRRQETNMVTTVWLSYWWLGATLSRQRLLRKTEHSYHLSSSATKPKTNIEVKKPRSDFIVWFTCEMCIIKIKDKGLNVLMCKSA